MTTTNPPTNAYLPNPELQKQAMAAIAKFEQSIAPSAWPFLTKATVIAEMRARVQNPFQVNQGGQPFCGPSAVLFELIYKQPVRYVEMCQSLFLMGGFHGYQNWLTAPDKLRQDSRGDLHMGQVDWMVLSTLRESETILFPVEPNSPDLIRNLTGMTKSWEMKGWVREILGYSKVKYNHAYLLGDFNALADAQQAIAAGGVAFALITAEGMLTNKPPAVAVPNHWIGLIGGFSIQPAQVSFDVYTWSRQMRVNLSSTDFKKYLWATVTGRL